MGSVFARFGAILAPPVVNLGATNPSLALVIFAVPCLASGALDLFLPETRGRRLPNTFEDVLAEQQQHREGEVGLTCELSASGSWSARSPSSPWSFCFRWRSQGGRQ